MAAAIATARILNRSTVIGFVIVINHSCSMSVCSDGSTKCRRYAAIRSLRSNARHESVWCGDSAYRVFHATTNA
jgi:hypothetical protein